ncbi:MAG: RDD family protein [Bacilli bacterium]
MKRANFWKRFTAYMIDVLLLWLTLFIIELIIPVSDLYISTDKALTAISENFVTGKISLATFLNGYATLIRIADKEQLFLSLTNVIFILIYFCAIPYFFDGKTIGKKLMGIKIARKDGECLTLNSLLIRNMVINGLASLLISLVCIFILPGKIYFIVTSIFGIIQILLVIASGFMVLYRKDKRGLQDIFSQTNVVLDK